MSLKAGSLQSIIYSRTLCKVRALVFTLWERTARTNEVGDVHTRVFKDHFSSCSSVERAMCFCSFWSHRSLFALDLFHESTRNAQWCITTRGADTSCLFWGHVGTARKWHSFKKQYVVSELTLTPTIVHVVNNGWQLFFTPLRPEWTPSNRKRGCKIYVYSGDAPSTF